MGVTRTVSANGNQQDKPEKGDEVTIEYTGYLYNASKATNDYRGNQFDSSVGRGDFKTAIGVGKVVRGWDEGVMEISLGEKSTLTISSDYAYGDRGFPDLIPPNSALIFDVHLKGINDKKA